MPDVLVHNITDRPNTPGGPRVIILGAKKIRPGKALRTDSAGLNKKFQAMHGQAVWIGNSLPSKFTRTSKSALKLKERTLGASGVASMDLAEIRAYLDDMGSDELLVLCGALVPPLEFAKVPSARTIVSRLSRALLSADRIADPEKFFWLRRWVRSGDMYIEKE